MASAGLECPKKNFCKKCQLLFHACRESVSLFWGVLEHSTCGCHFLGFAVFTVQVNSEISFTL